MIKNKNINTDRIRRTSRLFIRVLLMFMVLVPLGDCILWIFMNDLLGPIQHELLPSYVRLPLPVKARFLGWVVSLLQLAVFLYATATLLRLFRLYEQGRIFDDENVRCFSLLSRSLICWCVMGVLVDPLQSIALTLHHPEGQRMLSLGLSSDDLSFLLVGGILAVISWVMEEARKIKEEQELTI